MSEKDAEEAKRRAEWLHKNNAPKNWIILTNSEISTIRAEFEAMERERDEAREKIKRQAERIRQLEGATNHAGGTPLSIALRERNEVQAKYDTLAAENMLEVHKLCKERDEWAAMCGRYKQERDDTMEKLNEAMKGGAK